MHWSDHFDTLRRILLQPQLDTEQLQHLLTSARPAETLPVIWLLGKTQAGKSSIVRALTANPDVLIGNGFQPCTRTLAYFDYPAAAPVVRFLDTRGLGEVAYDPSEDLRWCESQAHLLLGVMRADDPNPQPIFTALRELRQRHPEWPLVIAQTSLHTLYPADLDHPQPYPFAQESESWPTAVPPDLVRALRQQRASAGKFAGAAPHWVAVDFTMPEDGYPPADYGLTALWQVIETVYQQHLWAQLHGGDEVRDLYARTSHPHIVGYALAAGALGALPMVDLVAVPTLQAKLLHSVAAIYRQTWDARTTSEFLGLLGVGIGLGYVARLAGRQLVKLVPGVGQTVGAVWSASSSAAVTYALGKTAAVYFQQRLAGQVCDAATLRNVFNTQLVQGGALLVNQVTSRKST
ncbi:YcjF family protein [Thiospirillum jenense]|uniref:50S ribosome-binding GTPase n=1 Tax=Thiospirillum jenense TaxID=1653858 RepID=A0A839HCX7_9GAMM|nr:GTPase [Thiospirillum jenense]MBB1125118.1 50S ribosome-binding GTPase [Thiospirillum jenense]